MAVGRLVAGHGVRGLARVKPHNPNSPALTSCAELWLRPAASDVDEPPKRLTVSESRPHKGVFLVGFDGVSTLDELEPWIGSEVFVEKDTLPAPSEDEIYDFEAIGLEVRTVDDVVVGRVVEVMVLGGNGVWVVHGPRPGQTAPHEVLVPVVGEIVKEIDLPAGIARIDPPPGLIEE